MINDSTFFFKPEEISRKISDVQGMFRCSEAQDARSAGARTLQCCFHTHVAIKATVTSPRDFGCAGPLLGFRSL